MFKYVAVFFAMIAMASVALVGCGSERATDSQAAIQRAQDLASVQEKSKYLLKQAYTFLEASQYKEAIAVAEYVLNNVDRNSAEAKALLKTAKSEWMKVTQENTGEVQTVLTGMGEE